MPVVVPSTAKVGAISLRHYHDTFALMAGAGNHALPARVNPSITPLRSCGSGPGIGG